MKKKKTRRIVIVVAVLAGIVGAAFFYLCTGIYHADPSALGAMQPGGGVQVVETEQTIAFIPKNNPEGNALVFYPGAKVDADAYGPLARAVWRNSLSCA